jgi:hypothetical protein
VCVYSANYGWAALVFRSSEFVLTAAGQHWPADEGLVHGPDGGAPVAVIRAEPWPEVWERPWPDGALRRPWLSWLFGIDGNPEQSRTVVRRMEDGYVLLRLHRRAPLFHRTVGIFDGEDRRVGYCRWSFKGAGPPDEFVIVRADHTPAAEVRRVGATDYRVSGADGGAWASLAVSAAVCRASTVQAGLGEGRDEVLMLAAIVVLFQLACGRQTEPGAATAGEVTS